MVQEVCDMLFKSKFLIFLFLILSFLSMMSDLILIFSNHSDSILVLIFYLVFFEVLFLLVVVLFISGEKFMFFLLFFFFIIFHFNVFCPLFFDFLFNFLENPVCSCDSHLVVLSFLILIFMYSVLKSC